MEGFSVLIVDDEIHAVRGMQAGVDWQSLGVSDIYTANNKKQAQNIFDNHSIDLLLSDIEMPQGSGIDLLTWVRDKQLKTEAIFISCHSDFKFAKQALSLKGFNYLLKPIDYKELESEIKEVFKKIIAQRKVNEIGESFRDLQKVHQLNQYENFWKYLITKQINHSKEEINNYLTNNNIYFEKGARFLPMLAYIYESNHESPLYDKSTVSKKLSLFLQTEMKKQGCIVTMIKIQPHYILFILHVGDNKMNEQKMLNDKNPVLIRSSEYLLNDIGFYVGKQVPIYKVASVVQTLKKIKENNITKLNEVIYINDFHAKQSFYTPKIPKEEWIGLINMKSGEKIYAEISEYITSWKKDLGISVTRQSLHLFHQDFLQMIFYILQTKGIDATKVFSNEMLVDKVNNIDSVDEFRDWILFLTRLTIEQIQPVNENQSIVDYIKQFIEENIGAHDLTRNDIANHVYLNADYVTRIFKKQVGMSITDFIRTSRMEYAKQLLINTDMTISTISLECGYTNFSYFSTLFKRYADHNPMEFRKKYSNNII